MPFLMMESSPASTNWQGVSKLKKPGVVLATSLQSIAHGSDGAMYFQMRQSRGAEEKFHGAVIDHYGGSDTRTFREVCETGRALETLKEVAGARVRAESAVLYDWENRWALEGSKGPRNDGLHYREHVEKSYRALVKIYFRMGICKPVQSRPSLHSAVGSHQKCAFRRVSPNRIRFSALFYSPA